MTLCCLEDEKWDTHRFQKTGKKKHQTKVTTKIVFDGLQIVQSGIQIVKIVRLALKRKKALIRIKKSWYRNRKALTRIYETDFIALLIYYRFYRCYEFIRLKVSQSSPEFPRRHKPLAHSQNRTLLKPKIWLFRPNLRARPSDLPVCDRQ